MAIRKEVSSKNDSVDRKREVLDSFLGTFIAKGLSETSVRDLSASIHTQSAGMYYYFPSKEDAVVACAEEAAIRLENNLIMPALKDVSNPERLIKRLGSRAEEMAPTMKFLVQVCAVPKYEELIRPTLDRLSQRYDHYAQLFAEKIGCSKEEIEPYMYMSITAVTNYMVFNEKAYIRPQMQMAQQALERLLKKEA